MKSSSSSITPGDKGQYQHQQRQQFQTSMTDYSGAGMQTMRTWQDHPTALASRANSVYPDNNYSNIEPGGYFNDNSNMDMDTSSFPMCHCGLTASRRISQKEHSLGEPFFACPRNMNDIPERCKFFQWEDSSYQPQRSTTSYSTMATNDNNGNNSRVQRNYEIEVKKRFGHQSGFRPGQKDCIVAALAGRDVFCLMPTGGGKSLVYQVPAWCERGVSIVFSPLLSLIVDQVDALDAIGIRAASLTSNGDDSFEYNRQVMHELFQYEEHEASKPIKLLYVTPERYKASARFKELLGVLNSRGLLSRFVVDEAHCLSQVKTWENFRSAEMIHSILI